MKRSRSVPLLVLGSIAGLQGCAPDRPIDLQQNRYLSREDCLRDWGNDQECAPAGAGNSSGFHGGGGSGGFYYYGPRYYWDAQSNRPVAIGPNGEARVVENAALAGARSGLGETLHVGSISRGGFGSFGRGFSLGG